MTDVKLKEKSDDKTAEPVNPGGPDVIVGIDAICDYLKRGFTPTMDLIQKMKIPAKKNQENVWCLDVEKFQKWCREMDWNPWKDSDKDLARKNYRRDLMAAGPGFEIRGDLNVLEKNLGFSVTTLMEFMRFVNCPIEKIPGTNQYRVYENTWILFIQEHGPQKIRKDRSWAG
jgi:hypothetical protein